MSGSAIVDRDDHGPRIELRELTPDDRAALVGFSCRGFREPWSELIEETVQERLADELGAGDVAALGAGATAAVSMVHWDNDAMIELNVGLGANVKRIEGDPDYCYCIIPLS